jgi:feruloyl esterase
MNHCFGGSGPTNFGQQGVTPVVLDKEHDAILALEAWVEHGAAPDRMIGSHVDASGNVTFTRPLCPYPEEAVYEGHGDTTDAANFACRVREDDRNDRDPFSLHK